MTRAAAEAGFLAAREEQPADWLNPPEASVAREAKEPVAASSTRIQREKDERAALAAAAARKEHEAAAAAACAQRQRDERAAAVAAAARKKQEAASAAARVQREKDERAAAVAAAARKEQEAAAASARVQREKEEQAAAVAVAAREEQEAKTAAAFQAAQEVLTAMAKEQAELDVSQTAQAVLTAIAKKQAELDVSLAAADWIRDANENQPHRASEAAFGQDELQDARQVLYARPAPDDAAKASDWDTASSTFSTFTRSTCASSSSGGRRPLNLAQWGPQAHNLERARALSKAAEERAAQYQARKS